MQLRTVVDWSPTLPPAAGVVHFLHFYRIGLDGESPVALTPGDGTHTIQLSPSRKYVVDTFSNPGPQTGSTGSRAFTPARGDRHALAEIGFIVVTIDGMGTPGRSKSFQDACYGAMGRDNTFPTRLPE
jgi:Prolyl oligopeptidase family/Dipeptidyl peptidase IV (DPP IV) N-terminal region